MIRKFGYIAFLFLCALSFSLVSCGDDDDDADGTSLNPVVLNQGEHEGGDQNQHKNIPEGFQELAPKRGFAHVEGVFAVGGLALDDLFSGETGCGVNFEGFQGVFDGLIVEISHKASISGGGGFV